MYKGASAGQLKLIAIALFISIAKPESLSVEKTPAETIKYPTNKILTPMFYLFIQLLYHKAV